MSHLAKIRQQQSWGRRALGLFVAVWLNLALQPCAMALDIDDGRDCPNCPPAETHAHGDMHASMDSDTPCLDGSADCMLGDDWNHDGRSGQCKLKDAPADTPLVVAPHELAIPFHQPATVQLPARYASMHAGVPPPLHVLYCVYLK